MRAFSRPLRSLSGEAVLGLALALSATSIVQAQPEDKDEAEPVKEVIEAAEDTGAVTAEPHGPQRRPQPPNTDTAMTEEGDAEIGVGAGMGSDLAYAEKSVVELGGMLAITHASQTTILRLAPSAGYFVFDSLELTLFPEFSVIDVSGTTDVSIGVMIEPSYHIAFSDTLYGFGGVGFGIRYSDDPGVDFALRPALGVDIMVGRSGILKPLVFLDIGANDGLTQGGFAAAFTVML
jgi:hypothetical protein